MKKLKIKHSESKNAWNIVGTEIGGLYKVARLPYTYDEHIEIVLNERNRREQLKNAVLFKNAPILYEYLKNIDTKSLPSEVEFALAEIKNINEL